MRRQRQTQNAVLSLSSTKTENAGTLPALIYQSKMTTPVKILEEALAPLLNHSVAVTRLATEQKLEIIRKRFETHGWDAGKAFPYPESRLSRAEFAEAKALYDFARAVTRSDTERQGVFATDPVFRLWDASAADRALALAKRTVREEFEAFVAKLAGKLGNGVAEIKCRTPAPDGLWAFSEVEVKRANGTFETWRTQVVLNTSKYGRPFLQWPTRKISRGD